MTILRRYAEGQSVAGNPAKAVGKAIGKAGEPLCRLPIGAVIAAEQGAFDNKHFLR
jgi:hypothetical protein